MVIPLLVVLAASVAIRYACDWFEPAADHLGRNLPPGVKGATINAVGSSLPELLTSIALLFEHFDRGGFAAAVATCAGSAVFNIAVIPALCLLAARRAGVDKIVLDRGVIVRDGLFFVIGVLVLLDVLGEREITVFAGLALVGIYVLYLVVLYTSTRRASQGGAGAPAADEGEEWTSKRAWAVIAGSVAVLAVACHFLAQAVVDVAIVLDVAPYFTALILAAIATSVPDTILSVKDALKGEYDDAVANAVGSNTFDIGIGIGLPLLVYTLVHGTLQADDLVMREGIRELMVVLLVVTAFVLGMLVATQKIGLKRAFTMLGVYGAFAVWVLGDAAGWW